MYYPLKLANMNEIPGFGFNMPFKITSIDSRPVLTLNNGQPILTNDLNTPLASVFEKRDLFCCSYIPQKIQIPTNSCRT